MKKSILKKALSIGLSFCMIASVFAVSSVSVYADTSAQETTINSTSYIGITPSEGKLELISKKTYAGGSTLSFDAYISNQNPNDMWWGIDFATDTSEFNDVYTHTSNYKQKEYTGSNATNDNWGKWVSYTVDLPDDATTSYYFALVLKPGANTCYFDNFKIIDKSILNGYDTCYVFADEDFEYGLEKSIFNYDSSDVSIINYAEHISYNSYVSFDKCKRDSTGGTHDVWPLPFVSKQAYPAGSTVTFDAFIPENAAGWWGVGFSNTASSDIYDAASHNQAFANKGKWATYTVSFPSGDGSYYFYIAPSCDAVEGDECKYLIDNVVVSNNNTTLAKETFEFGLDGIFNLSNRCVELVRENIKNDFVASVNFDHSYQNISMTTKQKIAAGSTITFDAYVPTEPSWWAVSFTTAAAKTDDWYTWTNGGDSGKALTNNANKGKWASYSITVPTTDANGYYMTFSAELKNDNSRTDTTFLFDNFCITNTAGVTTEYETFTSNLSESIFNFYYYNSDLGQVSSAVQTAGTKVVDKAVEVYPNKFTQVTGNFVSKNAYPAGSTVYFDAFVPTGALNTWWGFTWGSDTDGVSVYDLFDESKGKVLYDNSKKGKWVNYSFTIGGEGNKYISLAAAPGEWSRTAGDALAITFDNFVITDANGYIIDDEYFNNGFDESIFRSKDDVVYAGGVTEDIVKSAFVPVEKYAEITANNISTNTSTPTFISKEKYAPGTTITFDAYVPKPSGSGGWWGIGYTTDNTNADVYNIWETTTGKNLEKTYNSENSTNAWKNYSITIPSELTEDVYFFLAAAVGEFDDSDNNGKIKLDNFVIQTPNPNGKTITENFNMGVGTLFDYDEDVVSLYSTSDIKDVVYSIGDLNGDNAVTLVDFVIEKKALSGLKNLGAYAGAADFDSDGDNSVKDLALMRKTLLGLDATVNHSVNFTAYSAPTLSGKVVENSEALSIAYQKLREAGFTKAIALHEGASNTTGTDVYDTISKRSEIAETAATAALTYAEKYGIKYYVKDWSLYGLGANKSDELSIGADQVSTESQFKQIIENMFTNSNPYIKNSAYAGNFGWDEPTVKDWSALGFVAKYYYQQMNALGVNGDLLVNLLPSYVGSQGTGEYSGWWIFKSEITKDYSTYIDEYISKIAPYTGYISWDYYPFMESFASAKESREKGYLYNYALMANKCKANNLQMRTFIQSCADNTNIRSIQSKADLGFQIYNGLAFGVNEFSYFEYSSANATTGSGIYNQTTGKYTDVYEYAAGINHEILKMDNVLGQYSWDATMAYNNDTDASNFIDGVDGYTVGEYASTSISSASADTVVGCFKAKDTTNNNNVAYMVVNESDPLDNKTDTVVLNVSGVSSVIAYVNGEATVVNVVNNQVTIDVASGSGVFVIPQK